MLIPSLQVVASHHAFLYAHTVHLVEGLSLFVARSTALPKTDDWYKPVAKLLDSHHHQKQWSEIVADKNMMFGEAEHTMYRLGDI